MNISSIVSSSIRSCGKKKRLGKHKNSFESKLKLLVKFDSIFSKSIMKLIFTLLAVIASNCYAFTFVEKAFIKNEITKDSKIAAPKKLLKVSVTAK